MTVTSYLIIIHFMSAIPFSPANSLWNPQWLAQCYYINSINKYLLNEGGTGRMKANVSRLISSFFFCLQIEVETHTATRIFTVYLLESMFFFLLFTQAKNFSIMFNFSPLYFIQLMFIELLLQTSNYSLSLIHPFHSVPCATASPFLP